MSGNVRLRKGKRESARSRAQPTLHGQANGDGVPTRIKEVSSFQSKIWETNLKSSEIVSRERDPFKDHSVSKSVNVNTQPRFGRKRANCGKVQSFSKGANTRTAISRRRRTRAAIGRAFEPRPTWHDFQNDEQNISERAAQISKRELGRAAIRNLHTERRVNKRASRRPNRTRRQAPSISLSLAPHTGGVRRARARRNTATRRVPFSP